jgi:hypothetical protein
MTAGISVCPTVGFLGEFFFYCVYLELFLTYMLERMDGYIMAPELRPCVV